MPNTGTDTGMMFGRDDLRVLEASAGAVREQLNAQAAAASDTPMNPFKAILGGAEAAAQIKKQADAQDKMAKSNAVQASWYDLITSEKYMTSKNLDRVNMIEDFMKAYAEDTDTELMSQKLAAGQYTKAYQGFIQERDNAVLSQVYADHKRWQEENPDKGPQDYVEWIKSVYPTIDRASIRDALVVGLYDEASQQILEAKTQDQVTEILNQIKENAKPFENPYFLNSKNSAVQKQLTHYTSQLNSTVTQQRKAIADIAQTTLQEIQGKIKTAYAFSDLGGMVRPIENPQLQALVREAYYGDTSQMQKHLANIDKEWVELREKTLNVENMDFSEESRVFTDKERPFAENLIANTIEGHLERGEFASVVKVANMQAPYLSKAKTAFKSLWNGLSDPLEVEQFVATVNNVIAQPDGAVAAKALFGEKTLSDIMVLDYLVKNVTNGDVGKAKTALAEAEGRVGIPYDGQGAVREELMKIREAPEFQNLTGDLRARANAMFQYIVKVAPDASTAEDMFSNVLKFYNGMLEEVHDPYSDTTIKFNKVNGTPLIFTTHGDLGKQAFVNYLSDSYNMENISSAVYVGNNNVKLYDKTGSFLDLVNLDGLSDDTIREYAVVRPKGVLREVADTVDVGISNLLTNAEYAAVGWEAISAYIDYGMTFGAIIQTPPKNPLYRRTPTEESASKKIDEVLGKLQEIRGRYAPTADESSGGGQAW
ncbi:MAG: hypothetical protein B6U76_00135 [Desulfurococcales archaeon ex4484_217_2]|nr:MAG: hypothetical protein B6U76_00135 [Desulfurococcales archaeon ex4484_217_2]